MNIDIIIPVYNEAANIEKNLDSINEHICGLSDNFRVAIIYDFDEDNTLPVIKKIQDKYSFKITLVHNENGGVCSAIKKGFQSATGDFVLVTMADLSDDYGILPGMAEQAKAGYDIICASRYMKGGKLYGGPFIKQLLSRFAGVSLYYLAGIPTHDITNSYKLYRKDMLDKIEIESTNGFEIGMEITAKAYLSGCKITELPSRWWDRTGGESKFKFFKWLPLYMKWYFFLLIRAKKLNA